MQQPIRQDGNRSVPEQIIDVFACADERGGDRSTTFTRSVESDASEHREPSVSTEATLAVQPPVSRRGFLALAGAAASSLVFASFEGGFGYAYADEAGTYKWVIKVVARWQVAVVVMDPTKGNKGVGGANVTVTSLYNNKVATGVTADDGVVLLDARELAEPDHLGRSIYNFWGAVLVEKDGYRVYETGYQRFIGGKPVQAATQLHEGLPYARLISFDGWDIQYAKDTEFVKTGNNDETHQLRVKIAAPSGEDVTVSYYHRGTFFEEKKVKAQDGIATVEFSRKWLSDALFDKYWAFTVGKPTRIEVKTKDGKFSIDTTLVVVKGLFEDSTEGSGSLASIGRLFKGSEGEDEAITITLPEGIPSVGGHPLEIWTPEFPVQYEFEAMGYSLVGVGFSGSLLKKTNGQPLKKGWKRNKTKSLSDQWAKEKADWSSVWDGYKKGAWPNGKLSKASTFSPCYKLKAGISASALAGFTWDAQEGTFGGTIQGSASLSLTFNASIQFTIGPIPVYFAFDFMAAVTPLIEIAAELNARDLGSLRCKPGTPGFSIAGTIAVGIGAGAGWYGMASVGVRGSAYIAPYLGCGFHTEGKPFPHKVVSAGASADWVVQIFIAKWSGRIYGKDWPNLYDNWEGEDLDSTTTEMFPYCEAYSFGIDGIEGGFSTPSNPSGTIDGGFDPTKGFVLIPERELELTKEFDAEKLSTTKAAEDEAEVDAGRIGEKQDSAQDNSGPTVGDSGTANPSKAAGGGTEDIAESASVNGAAVVLPSLSVAPSDETDSKKTDSAQPDPEQKELEAIEPEEGIEARDAPVPAAGDAELMGAAALSEDDVLPAEDAKEMFSYTYYEGDGGSWTDADCSAGFANIAGISELGIKPSTEEVIFHDVYSDPRIKIVRVKGKSYLFRLATVGYPGGTIRTRLVASVYSGNTWGKPSVIEYTFMRGPGEQSSSRSNLFDYEFDVCVNESGWADGSCIRAILTCGRRVNGDDSSLQDSLSNIVLSFVTIDENLKVKKHLECWYYYETFDSVPLMPRIISKANGITFASVYSRTKAKGAASALSQGYTDEIAMEAFNSDGAAVKLMGSYWYGMSLNWKYAHHSDDISRWKKGDYNLVDLGDSTGIILAAEPWEDTTGMRLRAVSIDKSGWWSPSLKSLFGCQSVRPWAGHGGTLCLNDSKLMHVKLTPNGDAEPPMDVVDVGPAGFRIDQFDISPDGRWLYFTRVQEGKQPALITEEGKREPQPDIKLYQVYASKYVDGCFTEPFPFAELAHAADSLSFASLGQASAFLFNNITDMRRSASDLYCAVVPHVKSLEVVSLASVEATVSAGENAPFSIGVRNDGNMLIGGFTLTVTDERGTVIAEPRVVITEGATIPSVSDVVVPEGEVETRSVDESSSSIAESTFEFDAATKAGVIAPGKSKSYVVSIPIPSDWSGARDIKAAIKPGSLQVPESGRGDEMVRVGFNEDAAVVAASLDATSLFQPVAVAGSVAVSDYAYDMSDPEIGANTYAYEGYDDIRNKKDKPKPLAKTGDTASGSLVVAGLAAALGLGVAGASALRTRSEGDETE